MLIDAVVAAINAHGRAQNVNAVVYLAVVQFGLYVGNSLLQTVRNINQQALQELTAKRVQLMVMQHANRLDLSFFENPEFYDSLQQAQSGGGSGALPSSPGCELLLEPVGHQGPVLVRNVVADVVAVRVDDERRIGRLARDSFGVGRREQPVAATMDD